MSNNKNLFNTSYLKSLWARDAESFQNSAEAQELLPRLQNWNARQKQKETETEAAFIDQFFKQTWGYGAAGEEANEKGFTLWPQFSVKRAGQGGGTGKADISLGYFVDERTLPIPQVLGEFKDERSGLDKPQSRVNSRTPVEQCFDYLREARSGLNTVVLPTWGIVTDMNEFRLYIYGNRSEYQCFYISDAPAGHISLLDDTDEAAFERFLFYRMFHKAWLLADIGKSKLEKLHDGQLLYEQVIENDFYAEYHAYREMIYTSLREHNPSYSENAELFKLVKYTQRFLDRSIFVLYCEDMGQVLDFPPNILRDILIEVSTSKFYDPNGGNAWYRVKELFRSMRDGTPFGGQNINRFNGGLFADDAEMDAIHFPNRIFCTNGQGANNTKILEYPDTLLYFSAKYNFGEVESGEGRTLSLTAMGRIFEQSITDLEVMEAHAQGRESLVELTKRKRDGVYYTPEWVTSYIVENTIGTGLEEIRDRLDFKKFSNVTNEQIAEHHNDKRKQKIVAEYGKSLHQYSEKLNTFKVVDPACGSGAFLVQAFLYLYEARKWVADETKRVNKEGSLFDIDTAIRSILSENIYGVDINSESVEITKLTLWLNTAAKDRPLTTLDDNIRCGNSLVSTDFYQQLDIDEAVYPAIQKARVNTFAWEDAFPEVFDKDEPGFDCIVGNPPYVKLQHFRKIDEDVARYLLEAKRSDGSPRYVSTQTGNFDLYLPFIEKGISLLNQEGKMGYIAPSLWLVNDYGKALRGHIKRNGLLDRWIDFKSYQVFSDAITYTAIQFFTAHNNTAIRCAFAPKGREEVEMVEWKSVEDTIAYDELPDSDSWVFAPKKELALMERLSQECPRLDEVADKIIVGIQTSADYIYHLKRIAPNRYLHKPKKAKEYEEVAIEDAVMRPLVSGPEAKRYIKPYTNTWLLFPYEHTESGSSLIGAKTFESRYPKAWQYLRRYENDLRSREKHKMDRDDSWWGYNYPKNLDKQELTKLIVAQTVPGMRVCYDVDGEFYLNNVRVNGILPKSKSQGWYLLGILNSPVYDFIFKRVAKAKAGGYYEANKQFIAPLPIPEASEEVQEKVITLAQSLQELHTKKRDRVCDIDKRLESTQSEDDKRTYDWLWAEVKSVKTFKHEAPTELSRSQKSAWAKERHEQLLRSKLGLIDAILKPGVVLTASFENGELQLFADGMELIAVYLHEEEGKFIAAQWKQILRETNITEKFDAKKLLKLLLTLKKTTNSVLQQQVVALDEQIGELDHEIGEKETMMNKITFELYGLSNEEIAMVME